MTAPADHSAPGLRSMASRSRWSNAAQGRPLLFLHPGPSRAAGSIRKRRCSKRWPRDTRVLAPTHPGFGSTPAPRELTTVDDLAYLYLDLLDTLDLRDVVVVGVSLGGWIAAEMAVKSTERMSALVLANAVGIKPGDRETRDIADIYAITDKQLAELVWADPRAHGGQSEDAAGERSHRHGALAQVHRALCVVALYARSEAEGPAASHPRFRRSCCGARPIT